jgi:hypothetical protein
LSSLSAAISAQRVLSERTSVTDIGRLNIPRYVSHQTQG